MEEVAGRLGCDRERKKKEGKNVEEGEEAPGSLVDVVTVVAAVVVAGSLPPLD